MSVTYHFLVCANKNKNNLMLFEILILLSRYMHSPVRFSPSLGKSEVGERLPQ